MKREPLHPGQSPNATPEAIRRLEKHLDDDDAPSPEAVQIASLKRTRDLLEDQVAAVQARRDFFEIQAANAIAKLARVRTLIENGGEDMQDVRGDTYTAVPTQYVLNILNQK